MDRSCTASKPTPAAAGACYKAQLAIGGIQVARAIYDTLTMPGGDGKIHPFLAESVTQNDKPHDVDDQAASRHQVPRRHALDAQMVKDNLDHYRKDNLLFVFVFAGREVDRRRRHADRDGDDDACPWIAFPWFLWSSSRLGIMAEKQMKSAELQHRS